MLCWQYDEYGNDNNDIDEDEVNLDENNDSDNEVYSEREDEDDDVLKPGDVIALRTPQDVHGSFICVLLKR